MPPPENEHGMKKPFPFSLSVSTLMETMASGVVGRGDSGAQNLFSLGSLCVGVHFKPPSSS